MFSKYINNDANTHINIQLNEQQLKYLKYEKSSVNQLYYSERC